MKAVLLSLLASVCLAQPLPPSGDFSQLPTYLVGIGGEANPSGALISIAVRIGQSNLFSFSTMDTPIQKPQGAVVASLRTGAAYVAAHNGACFLFFLGDAGYSSGVDGVTLGAYSGGGGVYCNSHRFPKMYIGPIIRAIKISSSTVQPVAEFMFNWSF